MPRQNRVTPTGEIVAVSARGTFMGNRGRLHDDEGRIRRAWANKAWITCALEFKGRHRPVMSAGSYTELFFLDEAAALSAGHRPCAECRRRDFNEFKALWLEANPSRVAIPTVKQIDAILHAERVNKNKGKQTFSESLSNLPAGTMVIWPEERESYYLIYHKCLLKWTPAGYTKRLRIPLDTIVEVLTPKSIVGTLALGYRPAVHASLDRALGNSAAPD